MQDDMTAPSRGDESTQLNASVARGGQFSVASALAGPMLVSDTGAPADAPGSPESPRRSDFRNVKRLLVRVGLPLLGLIIIGAAAFALDSYRTRQQVHNNAAEQFGNVQIPLEDLVDQEGLGFTGTRSLVINGTLKVNEGLIVTPGTLPTAPTEGQIYYDQERHEPGYYNGSQFVYFGEDEDTGITSLGGVIGDVALDGSLQIINGTLTVVQEAEVADGDAGTGNEITNVIGGSGLIRIGAGTTVDPFRVGMIACANGQVVKSTGGGSWDCSNDNDTDTDTTYTAGTGISFNGTQINNDGIISLNLPVGGGLANSGDGQNVSLRLQDCADAEVLQYGSGSWECAAVSGGSSSFTITDGTGSQTVNGGNTVTFVGNEGLVATVSATDTVAYGIVNGAVGTLKLADGSVTSGKIADGAVTTIDLSNGAVTNTKLANNSLTVNPGIGLAGGGVVALGGSTTLSLQACADGQILQYDGTTSDYVCANDNSGSDDQTLDIASSLSGNTITYDLTIEDGNTVQFDDRDTLYTAATGGGLALNAGAFSLTSCPSGQVLRSTGSGTYGCSSAPTADTNTTYSAGSGLSLAGTTFNVNAPTCTGTDKLTWNGTAFVCASDVDTDTDTTYTAGEGIDITGTEITNTGVLTVAAATTGGNVNAPIALGGTAQNPTFGFANGSTAGQFWQWNGTAWELAELPPGTVEQDGVIGNEVVGVTGTGNGLTRSGAGTAVSPYTLAVNVGTGLSINGSNQITNDGVLSFSTGTSTALTNSGGQNPLVDLKPCADGEVLRYNTTSSTWDCVSLSGATAQSFDITDGTTTQAVDNGDTISFIGNEGLVAAVTATDTVTYGIATGGVTTIKLADGSITTPKLADGAVTTLKLGDNSVTSAKIVNGTVANEDLANSSLTVAAGDGLTGGGAVALGASTTLNLQPCTASQILKYDSVDGWICDTDEVGTGDGTGTDDQILSISNAPGGGNTITYDLTIEDGNTVQFDDRDTLYTAATGGGLTLAGGAFSLIACLDGEIVKYNAGTSAYVCAADEVGTGDGNTTYTAGTGIAINGSNVISNTGVLSVTGSGALSATVGQNPDISLATSGNFIQTGDELDLSDSGAVAGTFGDSGVNVTQLTVDAKGRITSVSNRALPTASASVTGVLSSIDFANFAAKENALTFNNGITRSGDTVSLDLADSGTSLTTNSASGLEVSGGGLSILRGCATGQLLKWNATTGIWSCAADIDTNTDVQTLSFDNGTRELTISGGNTVVIPDDDTLYTALTDGGLTLNGGAFSLQTCPVGEVLKSTNGTTPAYTCAADDDTDTNTTYAAGQGIELVGNVFHLDINVAGALVTDGAETPTVSLNTSSNFTQASSTLDLSDSGAAAGTYGNSGVNIAQLTVDAKGRLTSVSNRALPTATASVTGVLSSTDFATFAAKENALTFNAPISRSGNTISFNLTASGTTVTTTSASGLEISGGGLSILRGCSDGQLLKWNSTTDVWACSNDTDTNTDAQTLSFDNGTRVLTISGGNNVTIPDANTTYTAGEGLALASNTFSIDITGAGTGQVLTFDGAGVAWQDPTTPSCATGTDGTYFCQSGNSFGTAATLGTNDNFALNFETNNTARMTIDADGFVRLTSTADAGLASGSGAMQIGADAGPNLAFDDNEIIARNNGGTSTLFVQNNGGGFTVGATSTLFKPVSDSGDAFRVQNAAGTIDILNVDTVNGRVGIGTTGGLTGLEVDRGLRSTATNFNFNILSTDNAVAAQNVGGGIGFAGNTEGVGKTIFSAIQGFHESATASDYAGALRFFTRPSGSADMFERLRISSIGNITVGTSDTTGNQLILDTKTDAGDPIGTNGGMYYNSNLGKFRCFQAGAWADCITTASAPTTCSVSSTYVCGGGNTTGAALTLGTNDDFALNFETNNVTHMTLTNGGYVGIGTTPNSESPLHVYEDTAADSRITIENPNANGSPQLSLKSNVGEWLVGTNGSAGADAGDFYIYDTTSTYRFRIESDGDIGIGAIAAGTATSLLHLDRGTATSSAIQWTAGATTGQTVNDGFFIGINSAGEALLLQKENAKITFATNNTVRMHIDGNGNVGINLSSASHILAVGGDAIIQTNSTQGFTVQNSSGVVALRVDTTNQKVGIGIVNPEAKLEISSLQNPGGAIIANHESNYQMVARHNSATNGATAGIGFTVTNTNGNVGGAIIFERTNSNSRGQLGFYTKQSTTAGVAPVLGLLISDTGTVTTPSDRRLKEDIQTLSVLDKIDGLRGTSFTLKSSGSRQIGVIAQEIQDAFPEAVVMHGATGMLTVNYNAIAAIALQGVKELDVRLDDLEAGVWNGGIVTKDTTFKSAVLFEGPVTYKGAATFEGDVSITGKVKLSGDQVNEAILPAGQRRVEVTFGGRYESEPYVTATPREFLNGQYRVTEATDTGFVIEVDTAQTTNVRFDWHAFMKIE